MLLTKEAIVQADDRVIERADIPEWGEGGYAFICTLDARTRENWEDTHLASTEDGSVKFGNIRASLVALCLCDDKGTPLFSQTDVALLNKKNSVVIDRLFEHAKKVNRIGQQDVDDLVKNFETTPEDNLPSA